MPSTTRTRRRAKNKPLLTARSADKYALYLEAVQDPEGESDRMARVYRRLRGRPARRLREDFCGTAAICCAWVKGGADRQALGVDLDPEPLAWGRKHHLGALRPGVRERVTLTRSNVLSPALSRRAGARFDIICGLNFSYWILRERAALLAYFRRARQALAAGGLLVLDFIGGSDVLVEQQERTRNRGFTYVWDQASYDPVRGDWTAHIHFEFRDGTALRRAFTYHWRLWTLPELRDMLLEAGYARVRTYLEGDAPGGGGNGVYSERSRGRADRSFLAYIVAER